jgi:hypothetical protein
VCTRIRVPVEDFDSTALTNFSISGVLEGFGPSHFWQKGAWKLVPRFFFTLKSFILQCTIDAGGGGSSSTSKSGLLSSRRD